MTGGRFTRPFVTGMTKRGPRVAHRRARGGRSAHNDRKHTTSTQPQNHWSSGPAAGRKDLESIETCP